MLTENETKMHAGEKQKVKHAKASNREWKQNESGTKALNTKRKKTQK